MDDVQKPGMRLREKRVLTGGNCKSQGGKELGEFEVQEVLEWREGRRRGEEGHGTACRAWQVKMRSRGFLQVQLAAVERAGQKSA